MAQGNILGQDKKESVIVCPTEPTGSNRRKIWIQKGKNLFNNYIEDYGLEEDGDVFISVHRAISDFIPIEENLSYCISGAEIRMANFYDKDKRFVSGLNVLETPVFVAPTNACYIRVSFENTSDFETFQIEQGEEATEYEAYVEPNVYFLNKNGSYEQFVKKEERNIITASLASNHTVATKDVEKLDLIQKAKVGGLFEISHDGGIKIGTGITHVKVAGQICFSSTTVNGDVLGLYIFKNNATIEIVEEKTTGSTTLALPEHLLEVQEGDVIYLYARDRTTVGAIATTHSFLTVEAV